MLTSTTPFLAEGYAGMLARQMFEVPVPPSRRGAAPTLPITPRMDAVCMTALEKDRERRFATMRDMELALEAAMPVSSDSQRTGPVGRDDDPTHVHTELPEGGDATRKKVPVTPAFCPWRMVRFGMVGAIAGLGLLLAVLTWRTPRAREAMPGQSGIGRSAARDTGHGAASAGAAPVPAQPRQSAVGTAPVTRSSGSQADAEPDAAGPAGADIVGGARSPRPSRGTAPHAGQAGGGDILLRAQRALAVGDHARAIELASSQTRDRAQAQRAWYLIGQAACLSHNLKMASEAYRALRGKDREEVAWRCSKNHLVLLGEQFVFPPY
jgi:hypothetical protein